MQAQSIDFVTRALFQVLPEYLHPYVEDRLRERGIEDTWQHVFLDHDRRNGRQGRTYVLTDPAVQLRLLVVKIGKYNRQLLPTIHPAVVSKAHEVIRIRNAFAHPRGPLSDSDAMAVLVQVKSLFELLEIDEAVAAIDGLIGDLMRLQVERPEPAPEEQTDPEPTAQDEAEPAEDPEPASPEPGPHTEAPASTVPDEQPDADTEGGDDIPLPEGMTEAREVSEVQGAARGETVDALDSVAIEASGLATGILASSTIYRPQIPVRVRVRGGSVDIPVLRVSVALVVDSVPLTVENDQVVTVEAGESRDLLVKLALDRSALMGIDQVTEAALRVVLSTAGSRRSLFPETGKVTVYGPRNWLMASDGIRERTLAGFVQPQQPVLAEVLREADAILTERTGRGGLNAYQESAERNDDIVDAIARALHARGLTYANPPAAWAEHTQRIRSAEEVLSERLATCLDSTVLMASLLEQAGIDAQLWLLPGHIVLGYWRDHEQSLAGDTLQSPALLSNQIDRGALRLMETTALTAPEYPGAGTLHDLAHRAVGGQGADRAEQVIDVVSARKEGIYPLPIRALGHEGQVSHVEYTAERRDLAKLVRDNLPGTARQVRRDTDVPARVEAWKRELLDLSFHNRLINLTPRAAYSLAIPEEIQGSFEDMLHAGTRFSLDEDRGLAATQARRDVSYGTELDPPILAERLVDDHRVTIDISEGNYTRDLQKLASSARTVLEETGSNNLYLTLGTLHWRSDKRDLVSPLVLIPVTLTSKARGTRFEIALDETGSSTPNHSLLQRLAHDLELSIPGLEDPEADDAGIDLDQAFQAVRNALTEHRLPFHVETRVHLGLFNFGGFRLWKDLEENWRAVVANPLVKHLVDTPAEPFEDPATDDSRRDLDELVAQLPTTADASQAAVVSEAVAGRTIVVEGPPGTGKSQTITNLIVQAMVEGKRVLFVAEKQAALEVVSRRLAAAGVSDLVLNLHDVSLRPTAVKSKIRSALDLEATFDEEGFAADRRALEARRRELVHYRDALHTKNSASMSMYSSHTRELANGAEIPPLQVPAAVVPALDGARIGSVLSGLTEVAAASRAVVPRPEHPWRLFGGPVDQGTEGPLVDALLALHRGTLSTPPEYRELVGNLTSPDEANALAELLSDQGLPWQLVEEIMLPRWEQAVAALEAEIGQLRSRPWGILEFYRPDVITGPLDEVRTTLSEARTAIIGRRGKMRRALGPIARWEQPGRNLADEDIEHGVNELLALRDITARIGHMVSSVPGLTAVPPYALLDPRAEEYIRRRIAELRGVRAVRSSIADGPLADAAARVVPAERTRMAQHLRNLAGPWQHAIGLVGSQWPVPAGQQPLPHLLAALGKGSPEELTPRGLGLWMELERAVAPLREMGLGVTAEQVLDGAVDPVNLPVAFDKGLARASFAERLDRAALHAFDGATHDRLIDTYDALAQRVREGARSAIRSRIIAHREALSTPTSKRQASDLRREVSGRTRAPKIRPLIGRYGEVISRAMPCVLVSPESAARFIPLGEPMFDIVVFDEASQITVASAVGAMGRGRSVVVVGDSRQMPPTRFAQLASATTEELDEDETVPDEESILGECVSARVPRHWLNHHYRSRTEELIAFSNERYYEGRLATFPGPGAATEGDALQTPGTRRPGVRMRRVEGEFLRTGAPRKMLRTNPVEADAIVEEVVARFRRSAGEPSIGIVTFNMQQRDLIETRLRELGTDEILESLDDPDGLFVKNLENVQGDERDTILFSIAFSANERGEVPLNFGPLNREGGERRLNVAITRAREEVVVFSSFEPSQLHAERSTSIGLQDLRDYLDLAARGVTTLEAANPQNGAVDRHREDVADALRARGLQVRTGIGLSRFRVDIGVGPADGDLVLAVMLDGLSWAGRGTTVDRELLPRSVLTGVAGWPAVERVWLLDWIERRDEVLDRLVARIETTVEDLARAATDAEAQDVVTDPELEDDEGQDEGTHFDESVAEDGPVADAAAEEGPAGIPGGVVEPAPWEFLAEEAQRDDYDRIASRPADVPAPAPQVTDETDASTSDAPTARDPRSTARHRPWRAPETGTIADLDRAPEDASRAAFLTRLLESVVAAEYPISSDDAARQVIVSLGMKKVRATRIDALWQVVDRGGIRVDDRDFLWPVSVANDEFTGYRADVLRRVPIDQLHPQELRNAMTAAMSRSRGSGQETLMRETLALLGAGRMTEGIRSVLVRTYQDTTSNGPLRSAPTPTAVSTQQSKEPTATPLEEETLGSMLEQYASRMFSQEEVRSRLAEVITDGSLIDDLGSSYSENHDHIRRALLGPHDGDEWEEWQYSVEGGDSDAGALIIDAGRVLWNDMESPLTDAELDAQLIAVIIHALMWGYVESWYELTRVMDGALGRDPRYRGLLEDLLTNGQNNSLIDRVLSDLEGERDVAMIRRLFPVVEKHGQTGNRRACRVLRFWSNSLGDRDATSYWARRETGRTEYRS